VDINQSDDEPIMRKSKLKYLNTVAIVKFYVVPRRRHPNSSVESLGRSFDPSKIPPRKEIISPKAKMIWQRVNTISVLQKNFFFGEIE
jgi:hypothetical protein